MPRYEIEQYELHSVRYRVRAASQAEAIQLVLERNGEAIEESQEFIEVADRYGLAAELHPNLCAELTALGVEGIADVISSIREIEEVDAAPFEEQEVGVGVVLEPAGRETRWQVQGGQAQPAFQTYRVRYEIDLDAESPLAAARQAYVYMLSPESYRPVLEVALHQGTGEVDFSTAETFDLHELGCGEDRDGMARQLELVADIIESTYPHDANGRRVEGDSPVSGADVVDRLAALEQPIRDVLNRHAKVEVVRIAPTDTMHAPSLCVVLESEPHGRESFDHYTDLDEMLSAVKRLVDRSIECFARDGIERTVGIAIIPPEDEEEET